jgi:hypothetical protein
MMPIDSGQSGQLAFHERQIALPGKKIVGTGLLPFSLVSIRRGYDRVRSRGLLKQAFITGQTPIEGLSRAHALGGRALLLFTALLLAVMPWTEYYWHFDRFLRGGQDCEFGILFIATIFSLALVLSQCRKQTTALLHTLRRWISDVFQNPDRRALLNLRSLIAALHATLVPDPPLGTFSLPLQI